MNASKPPTVIIPIYNAPRELAVCLDSLHRNTPPQCEVLLLDDASDDPLVQPLLRRWLGHAGPGWSLELQVQNLGFVATVNRGMQMTRDDVVLLNSDTVLTPGWIEGLQRCLASDDTIATATPWTNNGEIVSLPAFCQANPLPADAAAIARVIAATGQPAYPEIPTAVGFCMAISRAAIDSLGLFDQELFGLGYGEENDFSMRARHAGMRNVLCDDVYVAHVGGRSFAPRNLRPDDAAMQKLLSRHPGYLQLIQAFIAADPLAGRRNELVSALRHGGIEIG
jgi:GT2 family glycosyltransferase